MSATRGCHWLMPLLALAFLASAAPADEAQLKGEVAALFELGWQPTMSARTAAAEQFAKLQQLAPIDRRIPYAYALVQIRQRKYPDAARLVAGVLSKEKDNWHAWRTKIWLSMLMKEYATALAEMDELSRRVAELARGDTPGRVENLQLGMARFLGRMHGFLAGPGADEVSHSTLDEAQRRVLETLTEAQREAFREARRGVADRFAQLTSEGDRTREQAVVDAERQKREMQAHFESEAKRIAAALAELEPLKEKFESEFKSEMADLQQKEQPLLERLARLETEATFVQRQALPLASDIQELERQAAREKDPARRRRLRDEASRIAIIYRRYDAQLAALEREANAVNAQRAQLLALGQQVQARYQRDMGGLQKQARQLDRDRKRIEAETRKLGDPVRSNTPRVREIARIAQAFTTYEEFPLETERRRILESFD